MNTLPRKLRGVIADNLYSQISWRLRDNLELLNNLPRAFKRVGEQIQLVMLAKK